MNLNVEKFSFPKRYGGNIRVFYQIKRSKKTIKKIDEEKKLQKKLIKLQKLVDIWKIIKRNKILSLNKNTDPCHKAFPGRAPTKIIKFKQNNIYSVYEKNKKNWLFRFPRISIVADKST